MHFGSKCKISWSNDDLERCKVPESIRSQGAMADRVKLSHFSRPQNS